MTRLPANQCHRVVKFVLTAPCPKSLAQSKLLLSAGPSSGSAITSYLSGGRPAMVYAPFVSVRIPIGVFRILGKPLNGLLAVVEFAKTCAPKTLDPFSVTAPEIPPVATSAADFG